MGAWLRRPGVLVVHVGGPFPRWVMPKGLQAPSPRAKNRPRYTVRCLGPLLPDHVFASLDPKRERVCLRCRELIRLARLGAVYTKEPTRATA